MEIHAVVTLKLLFVGKSNDRCEGLPKVMIYEKKTRFLPDSNTVIKTGFCSPKLRVFYVVHVHKQHLSYTKLVYSFLRLIRSHK